MRFRNTKLLIMLVFCAATLAQEGPIVNQSSGPPATAWTKLYFYDGGGNLTHICYARSTQPLATFSIDGGTLTSIVDAADVATATTPAAHGLQVGNAVAVSGTSDPDLNAVHIIASMPSATTFTFATANVTDGTYSSSGVQLTTRAPRSTEAVWAVRRYQYNGSNKLTHAQWAGGEPAPVNICDNRGSLAYR